MSTFVYEYRPTSPGTYRVTLKCDTIYNYSFQSSFNIIAELPESAGTVLQRSAIQLPAIIVCHEGQKTEIKLCEANSGVTAVVKLAGPGLIVRKSDGYYWSHTPDYSKVPSFLKEVSDTLVISSHEGERGTFLHTATVKTIGVLRAPKARPYTLLVDETKTFSIPISDLIENPDNVPLISFTIVSALSEIPGSPGSGGIAPGTETEGAGGAFNEIVFNEYVFGFGGFVGAGGNGGGAGGGGSSSQSDVSAFLAVEQDRIVGRFPLGFVPRKRTYAQVTVTWAAIFSNGSGVVGQINIFVTPTEIGITGQDATFTVRSGQELLVALRELFHTPVPVAISYTVIEHDADLRVTDNGVALRLFAAPSEFKFPVTRIIKTYTIRAETIEGQVAYATVTVTYYHTFRATTFRTIPVFRVRNYRKARLDLTPYINAPDELPVSSIDVVAQGFKPLGDVAYYSDDRDKFMIVSSNLTVQPEAVGFDPKLWGSNLKLRNFLAT